MRPEEFNVTSAREAPSLIMRRPGVRGFDPVQFHHFDGPPNPPLLNLDLAERASLFQHDLVELVIEVFQVREMGFNLFEPFGESLVHCRSVVGIPAVGQSEGPVPAA
jgi:hypothetical protein